MRLSLTVSLDVVDPVEKPVLGSEGGQSGPRAQIAAGRGGTLDGGLAATGDGKVAVVGLVSRHHLVRGAPSIC